MLLQYEHVLLAFSFIQKAFPSITNEILVKPGDTLKLICPYEFNQNQPMTWTKSSTGVAIGDRVINLKYGVSNNIDAALSTFEIKNFSFTDIDTYSCATILNKTAFQKKFTVRLCNVFVARSRRDSDDYQDLLCETDNDDVRAEITTDHHQEQFSNATDAFYLLPQNFTCSVLDNDHCVTQEILQIQTFWKERTVITTNTSVVVSCFCHSSMLDAKSINVQNENETVKGYIEYHFLYLRNFPTLSARYCSCIPTEISGSRRTYNLPRPTNSILILYISFALILTFALGCVYCRKRKGTTANHLNSENEDPVAVNEYIDLPNNCPTQDNHNVHVYPIQNVHIPIDVDSEIQVDGKVSNIGESDTTTCTSRSDGSNVLPNDSHKLIGKELSSRKVTQSLNYVDVAFDAAKQDVKFRIRGDCKRTPYADIDFTLKADPLPESDSSDEEEDDDFMTLAGIEILMKKA